MIRRNPSHSESTKFVASWQKHFEGSSVAADLFAASAVMRLVSGWRRSHSDVSVDCDVIVTDVSVTVISVWLWYQCDCDVSVTVTSVWLWCQCHSDVSKTRHIVFFPNFPTTGAWESASFYDFTKMESSVVRRLVLAATLESQKDLPTINRCTDAETETETVCCIYTTPAWIGMGFGVWKEYRDRGNLPEKVSSHRSHDLFEIWLFAKREGTEFQNKWERWERVRERVRVCERARESESACEREGAIKTASVQEKLRTRLPKFTSL